MSVKTILTLGLLLPLVLLGRAGAGESSGDPLERELHQQQEKIQRLQAGLTAQQKQLDQSRAKETDLLGELNRIDGELQSRRLHLQEVEEKLARQKQLTAAKEEEVALHTQQHAQLRGHIRKRLQAFYRLGEVGILNALFATTTLPELISFELNVRHLIHRDQQAIAAFRAQLRLLTDHRQALATEEGKSAELLLQLQSSERELLASRGERELLLARVKSEELLYHHALREIEEATSLLGGTIAQLLAKEPPPTHRAPQAANVTSKTTFPAQKGLLPPPAFGPIGSLFGSAPGKFGATTHANGITIQAAPGSEVRAIFRGTVAYAGPLKGYGQLVIIDHGQNYFSLVGRLGRISTDEGREVAAGEVIGRMDEAAGLLEEGAHFEIRHGSEAIDPLPWLNPNQLPPPAATPARK